MAIRGLTVSYGGAPVLFSMDAVFPERSMTAIIGPNGAGKSTLLKAALGITKPLSGTVTAFGVPLKKAKRLIAYVPQRASVDWDFPTNSIDVVMMGLYRRLGVLGRVGRAERAAAMEALERVGMADFADRQIGKLSGGQQQRVFLARALAQNARLLLLDEPFAGVDAATERAIIDVLHALRAEGRTLAVVHHDLSTVEGAFDRVLLLNVRKIAEGTLREAFNAQNLRATYGGRLATAQLDKLRLGAF
ncbi:MAG: metal ABC transporter ATP-binding protein [Pseudomonadota bacterium]